MTGFRILQTSVDYIVFSTLNENVVSLLLMYVKEIEIARLKVSFSIPGSNKLTINRHFDCEILILLFQK